MISAAGQGTLQAVRLPLNAQTSQSTDSLIEDMMEKVPTQLWSKHDTDVGLITSAQPVEFRLKPGYNPPWVKQYPLKSEAEEGISKTI